MSPLVPESPPVTVSSLGCFFHVFLLLLSHSGHSLTPVSMRQAAVCVPMEPPVKVRPCLCRLPGLCFNSHTVALPLTLAANSHRIPDGRWEDMPAGSSGANATVLMLRKGAIRGGIKWGSGVGLGLLQSDKICQYPISGKTCWWQHWCLRCPWYYKRFAGDAAVNTAIVLGVCGRRRVSFTRRDELKQSLPTGEGQGALTGDETPSTIQRTGVWCWWESF